MSIRAKESDYALKRRSPNWPCVYTLECVTIYTWPPTLALDDSLIEAARRAGRHKTKKEAVTTALAEYVKYRKQLRILKAFGTVDFDPTYDYKAERRRARS